MISYTIDILFPKLLGVSLLLFTLLNTGYGQTGIPYITHFESREGYERHNWSICQNDHNTMLFANKKGLKSYDGSEWRYIEVPHVPLKISKHPQTGIVYILSSASAGYLHRDERGLQHYVSLLDKNTPDLNLDDILYTNNKVVLQGDRTMYGYGIPDHQLEFMHKTDSGGYYSGIIHLNGKLYTLIRNRGLFIVERDTILPSGIPFPDDQDEILFCIDHSENRVLTGMKSGSLLLFNGKDFQPFLISNENYLVDNELSDGVILNDTTYVFSTLYGGAILVNRKSGKIINTLNYENGMPDDEILAIGVDHYQGLWITYRYGTSRLDLNLPVRDFSNYPGLEGLISGVLYHNNKLYISTTTGLYSLSEVKNYEEVEIYLKRDPVAVEKNAGKQKKVGKEETPQPEPEAEEKEAVDEEEEKKGFLARLFRRKSKDKEDDAKDQTEEESDLKEDPEVEPVPPAKKEPEKVVVQQPQFIKKTISRLKSIEHVFKKVEGITSNCQQLISTPYGILVGTSSGLFLVNDHQVELISGIRNINFISKGLMNRYLVTNDDEIIRVANTDEGWEVYREILPFRGPLISAFETDSLTIWVSGIDVVYRISRYEESICPTKKYDFESVHPEELTLSMINDTLFLFSESMIQYYSLSADSFLHYSNPMIVKNEFSNIQLLPSTADDHWIKLDDRLFPLSRETSRPESRHELFSLFQYISSFHPGNNNSYWVIDDYSSIYHVDLSGQAEMKDGFDIFHEQITNESGVRFSLLAPEFDPSVKMVSVGLTAPYYLKHNSTQFQYLIKDRMDQWSEWSFESMIQLITGPGVYRVMVRARNVLGQVSEPVTISFTVQPPFYKTSWFYFLLIPVILGLLYLLIFFREKKLRRDKHILEQKVEERTREIQVQKQQIEVQKNEILTQKNDITSSITYARKIQNAVLSSKILFETSFDDYFIFYQPRDIVSGDFYWITLTGNRTIFAVADCTGHGVPGAFMSMLGNSFLNEITKNNSLLLTADQILNQLRDKISDALAQSGERSSTHDGMDIALCVYDKGKGVINFSGAYSSLYVVRDEKIVTIKGDLMPIGYYPKKKDFTSQMVKVRKGDVLYLFSDGYADQFGGPQNKKFTIDKFKKLLAQISEKPMDEQHLILEVTLKKWQGDNFQVDDILVMGLKL